VTAVVATIAPAFVLIALGVAFRRSGWPGEALWSPAERLTYFVLFPALLLRNLWAARLDGLPVAPMAAVIIAAAVAMTVMLLAMRPAIGVGGPAFTSLAQGSIRFNTYLGVALTAAFFGAPGVTLAAVYLAVMVPLGNVISVAMLAAHGDGEREGWSRMAVEIARNPLILACVGGAALNAAGAAPPAWIDGMLEILARAALPIGLLCVGAGLDAAALLAQRAVVIAACVLKLVAMPAITWAACLIVGLTDLPMLIVVLFNALPAAPTSYVLARQLGGDAGLMAGILTAQTALSAITLSVLLAWAARLPLS
jgi:hypothetical protein